MKQYILQWCERYWWLVSLIAGVGVAATALGLSIGNSIWFDEGYSILLAKSSFADLFALTAVDAHPPFYYVLLKLWGELFGFSELALRSMSAVAMGGAVSVLLVLLKRLFGTRIALVSLPLLVLAPFLLRYGYEVRMYGLATLIGVAGTYTLVRARETRRWVWWVTYALLVALGMYTLYMMAAVWLAHFVWLLTLSLRDKKDRPWWRWQWLYAYGGAVVVFLPYLPTFIYQLLHSALPGIGREVTMTSIVDIVTTLSVYKQEWAVGGWLSLLLMVVVVVGVIMTARVYRLTKGSEKHSLQLFAFLAVVPIVFFALLSLPPREPIYVIRYMAHVAIYLYAFVGIVIGIYYLKARKRWLARGVFSAMLALLVIGVGSLAAAGNFNVERMQQPHTAGFRANVICDQNTVVVADDPYTYIDIVFYYDDCDLTFYAPEEVAMAGGYAPLHGSTARIASAADLTAQKIVHVYWTGGNELLQLPQKYRLVQTEIRDKQVIDTYELIAE